MHSLKGDYIFKKKISILKKKYLILRKKCLKAIVNLWMYRYYSESMESLPLPIEMGMHVVYLWDKIWDLCTSFCWCRWNWVLRLHYRGCRGAILLCPLTHFIWICPEGFRCQPHEVWWKSYVVTDDSFLCFGDGSFVCCGFILSLFCPAVLWVGHRHGIGRPNGPINIPLWEVVKKPEWGQSACV